MGRVVDSGDKSSGEEGGLLNRKQFGLEVNQELWTG